MNTEKIIGEAFQLYMPQVRSEITDLTRFLIENTGLKDGKPINVLEIGTKFGGTFYIWNKLHEIFATQKDHYSYRLTGKEAIIISIDMTDGGLHGGISAEEMDKRDSWFAERFDNCHFIRGDSHHNYTQYLLADKLLFPETPKLYDDTKRNGSLVIPENTIDFLFIDGDHTYEGVKQDFEMYEKFVKKGGIIAFHDIIISNEHHERNVYVGEFWKELTRNRMPYEPNVCEIDGNEYEVIEFVEDQNQTWAGIGVLVKL